MTDVYEAWNQTVTAAVNKYARNYSPDAKQDLKQDCFVQIMENLEAIQDVRNEQGDAAARNYVFGICHNKITDVKHKLYKTPLTLSLSDPKVWQEAVQIAIQDNDLHIDQFDVDEAVKQLSREEQYVIRSSFFQGHTIKEIAQSVSKSERWVDGVKGRAIQKLREIMEVK